MLDLQASALRNYGTKKDIYYFNTLSDKKSDPTLFPKIVIVFTYLILLNLWCEARHSQSFVNYSFDVVTWKCLTTMLSMAVTGNYLRFLISFSNQNRIINAIYMFQSQCNCDRAGQHNLFNIKGFVSKKCLDQTTILKIIPAHHKSVFQYYLEKIYELKKQ